MITAALATMPGRPLGEALTSLRPQVDRICVWCNGPQSTVDGLTHLIDELVVDPTNALGDVGKLAFAPTADGLYLTCDDDLRYAPWYVAHMAQEVARWQGRAIVTLYGRTFKGSPEHWKDSYKAYRWEPKRPNGCWVNYAGTCFAAWDTRVLKVPSDFPQNHADEGLAAWAQAERVPIWFCPQPGRPAVHLLPPNADTLWNRHTAENFATRDHWIQMQPEWRLHRIEDA